MGVAAEFISEMKQVFGNSSPEVILDVGSRDLNESIELLSAFPSAKIIAFEPNPIQFSICQQRTQEYSNISVYEYACSDEESLVDFYVVEGNVGASSMLEPIHMPGGWDNNYQDRPWHKISGIKARRLENVLTELGIDKVDVIWMDVQGNELRALKGLGSYINTVKMIHAEAAQKAYYKDQSLKNDLEDWLQSQGFDTKFLDTIDPHPYGESDLVCIRKFLKEK
jgi:2-O-methyltransferase